MKQPAVGLYVCYWSLMDPLCRTQSLAYLLRLAAGGRRFALLTFEQPRFRLPAGEAAAVRRELADKGIYWYPLTYHKRLPLLATGFDCLVGVVAGAYAAWRHRPAVVHSRGSIPAAMALVLRRLCGLRFLYDADSRLSLEYADNGHWSRGSLAFRITSRVEAWARQKADGVVVLAEGLRQDFLRQFGVRAPVRVIPCCVDTEHFRFDPAARPRRRRELGLGGQKLFVYVGKLGPRYLVRETFAFLQAARQTVPDARLLVLSGDPPEGFVAVAEGLGVDPGAYAVRRADHADVPSWLSAADAGLALIRSAECERGSSPIKIGEYLAAGLPVVTTEGIGDFSDLVGRERVGAVLRAFDAAAYADCVRRLRALWEEGDSLRERCRSAALAHCDLDRVGGARYRELYDLLLPGGARKGVGPRAGRPAAAAGTGGGRPSRS
ncbi:MAG TPA: glycosyltransferase [Gemmataceae bacterium]|nr:glycosyltransferase [Gemmataceae bacterium]